MNKVAMIGPQHLSETDKLEIFPFLNEILHETQLTILAYRSFEFDIVRHFLTLPDEFAPHLTIYLVNRLEQVENYGLAESIRHLSSIGANVIELDMPHKTLTRNPYLQIWNRILYDQDEFLTFYNYNIDEQSKLLAPLKVAEELGKNAYIFHLSDGDEEKMNRPHKEKIEQIRTVSTVKAD